MRWSTLRTKNYKRCERSTRVSVFSKSMCFKSKTQFRVPTLRRYQLKTVKSAFHHFVKWANLWCSGPEDLGIKVRESVVSRNEVRLRLRSMFLGYAYFYKLSYGLSFLRQKKYRRLSPHGIRVQTGKPRRIIKSYVLLEYRIFQLFVGLKCLKASLSKLIVT